MRISYKATLVLKKDAAVADLSIASSVLADRNVYEALSKLSPGGNVISDGDLLACYERSKPMLTDCLAEAVETKRTIAESSKSKGRIFDIIFLQLFSILNLGKKKTVIKGRDKDGEDLSEAAKKREDEKETPSSQSTFSGHVDKAWKVDEKEKAKLLFGGTIMSPFFPFCNLFCLRIC